MQKVFVFIVCSTFFGCKKTEDSFKIALTVNKPNIFQIKLDTIIVKHPNTSFQGFFDLDTTKKNFLFFDELFSTVSYFNYNGIHINTNLSKGEGPKQVKGIQHYLKNKNENFILNGWSIYTFNDNWEKLKTSTLKWETKKSNKELEQNPLPDEKGIYEVKYFNNDWSLNTDNIIFNIESAHPKYNGYFKTTAREYFKTAKIWAVANTKSGEIKTINGRYPSVYAKKSNIPNFSNWYFDFYNDSIYVNFEADSLIYVYDKGFLPSKAFGLSGKIKNDNYRKTETYDDAMQGFQTDRRKYGYYYSLKCFPEKSLVFRCYKVGTSQDTENININNPDDENPMRMQIYQNEVLVGDVSVPNRFKIIGTDGTYFYADGFIDEEKGTLGLYRFALK